MKKKRHNSTLNPKPKPPGMNSKTPKPKAPKPPKKNWTEVSIAFQGPAFRLRAVAGLGVEGLGASKGSGFSRRV